MQHNSTKQHKKKAKITNWNICWKKKCDKRWQKWLIFVQTWRNIIVINLLARRNITQNNDIWYHRSHFRVVPTSILAWIFPFLCRFFFILFLKVYWQTHTPTHTKGNQWLIAQGFCALNQPKLCLHCNLKCQQCRQINDERIMQDRLAIKKIRVACFVEGMTLTNER